eukprot:scaffold944_cov115-Alexandrium_tamarense.AAC.14
MPNVDSTAKQQTKGDSKTEGEGSHTSLPVKKTTSSPAKPSSLGRNSNNDDNDVEVVDSDVIQAQLAAAAATDSLNNNTITNGATTTTTTTTTATAAAYNETHNSDDELQIVGQANVTNLPHNRQDCLVCRFKSAPGTNGQKPNLYYASGGVTEEAVGGMSGDNGFYVCDGLASDCTSWINGGKGTYGTADSTTTSAAAAAASGGGGGDGTGSGAVRSAASSVTTNNNAPHKNHCQATDRGPNKHFWKNMRTAIKEGRDPATANSTVARFSPGRGSAATAAASSAMIYREMMRQSHEEARASLQQSRLSGGRRRRSDPPPAAAAAVPRRRNRPANSRRSSPHDHQQRIRTQAMLEELYK